MTYPAAAVLTPLTWHNVTTFYAWARLWNVRLISIFIYFIFIDNLLFLSLSQESYDILLYVYSSIQWAMVSVWEEVVKDIATQVSKICHFAVTFDYT